MSNTTIIPAPDTSKLPVIKLEDMLALKVTDKASCVVAANNKAAAKEYIAAVEQAFAGPKSAANAAHKSICDLEKKFLGVAPSVVSHCVSQADSWAKQERIKQQEIVRQAERIQAEQARLELLAAEEQRKKEAEAALPWDDMPTPEVMPMRIPDPAPIVLPPVKATGFKEKFKPWSYRLKENGLMELVKAIAAGTVSLYDDFGTPILDLNAAHFKNAAKHLGDNLGKRYPGVEGYRETSLS